MHAVDLELEKPDRFYFQDVWEVAEEASADVICRLEGTNPCDSRHNCHFLGVLGFFRAVLQTCCYSCVYFAEIEEKLLESVTSWLNVTTNAVFDPLYSVAK